MKLLFKTVLFVLISISLQAQKSMINGIVTDDTGLPLPGVTIIVKNTSNGTQSDFDGKFKIMAAKGDFLVFSYIGFTTKDIKVTPKDFKDTLIVSLENGAQLDEVVVTGLKGKVSGLEITRANQVRKKNVRITLRGNRSIPVSNRNQRQVREQESYALVEENSFKTASVSPLSTFSIDVDRASYSNIRRFINNSQNIPVDAVKVEEMINYFSYNYPEPKSKDPFSVSTELIKSPWNTNTSIMRIGLKGKSINVDKRPASNLVFLLDVSGSMNSPNKLPLLKSALKVLVEQLNDDDTVSMVVYAGAAGLALPPTSGTNKNAIINAIDHLNAGGSTAGGQGIKLAYKIAEEQLIKDGNNRIILATDGDFNVGASSDRAMKDLIKDHRDKGIYLTCLGFGMGNYKDSKLETLSQNGNGNYAYIDTMQEARKILGTEFFGTIYTIAKDVKIQVEFNPQLVKAYRLIGYENRLLANEDFKDDKKDAGELGSGHTVTALYEIIPVGSNSTYFKKENEIEPLKYSKHTSTQHNYELATVKLRYKKPDEDFSKVMLTSVLNKPIAINNASEDFKFMAAVALFGMQLKKSEFIERKDKQTVIALAEQGLSNDPEGYRSEFVRLVKSYRK
jgi:Ca-activated chloride channel family protein